MKIYSRRCKVCGTRFMTASIAVHHCSAECLTVQETHPEAIDAISAQAEAFVQQLEATADLDAIRQAALDTIAKMQSAIRQLTSSN
jgi:hypothetical protein